MIILKMLSELPPVCVLSVTLRHLRACAGPAQIENLERFREGPNKLKL